MQQTDLILKAINANLNPKRVILFGSRASDMAKGDSDLDIAIIQDSAPKVGQKADIFLNLVKFDYDWDIEPDIHIFSEIDFERKLKQKDLFICEIAKGKIIYAQQLPSLDR